MAQVTAAAEGSWLRPSSDVHHADANTAGERGRAGGQERAQGVTGGIPGGKVLTSHQELAMSCIRPPSRLRRPATHPGLHALHVLQAGHVAGEGGLREREEAGEMVMRVLRGVTRAGHDRCTGAHKCMGADC